MRGFLVALSAGLLLLTTPAPAQRAAPPAPWRPFGTLRAQAELQQRWLELRLERHLPEIMRRHGIDLWVIPMREYNEDPVFPAIVSPTTFAARRRSIYVFHDRGPGLGVEKLALGGTSQGGVYTAFRSTRPVAADVGGRTAELWGDQQWQLLRELIEDRNPRVIGINVSEISAFSDGLTAGEYAGMAAALGPELARRFKRVEDAAIDLLAVRLPEEEVVYQELQQLVWSMIEEMFSERTITPGVTRTSDLVWWWRQRVNDLGLTTWFQPSVDIQRQGGGDLGEDPVIQRGDVLHCDVGIVALGLHTDTQHNAYVLRAGETAPPAGLQLALRRANRLQDILFAEVRPGRSGNEVLASTLATMRAEGLDGTMYTHPIGLNGHGAGPLIGRWDAQEGVPGRGDHKVLASMWFSSELQVTTPVPEWGGQRVRMAQEEDFAVGANGVPRWFLGRQDRLWVVK
ncbi:MAG: M24 family metallopeptidase [Gemmatimonadales bacterium]|nr:M24 family metallopeptidase [Gemmatimonadales bacterium]